nr:immunoglobulin light chain junction region [Macaca mulatta]
DYYCQSTGSSGNLLF